MKATDRAHHPPFAPVGFVPFCLILRWVEMEGVAAGRRLGRRRPRRARHILAAVVAAQTMGAVGAAGLVRPGGPLPALAADAAPLSIRGAPAAPAEEPEPDASGLVVREARPGTAVVLGPATLPATDDRRPRTFRGRPVHYDGWSTWGPRIRGCESGGGPLGPGSYTARNPTSSASGAYQVTDGSWGGAFGVPRAHLATPTQQEEHAYGLFLRRGTQPWAASQTCWELSF